MTVSLRPVQARIKVLVGQGVSKVRPVGKIRPTEEIFNQNQQMSILVHGFFKVWPKGPKTF